MFSDQDKKIFEEVITLPSGSNIPFQAITFPNGTTAAIGVSVRVLGNQEPDLLQMGIKQNSRELWPPVDIRKMVPKEGEAFVTQGPDGQKVYLEVANRDFDLEFVVKGAPLAQETKLVVSFYCLTK